MAKEKCAKCKMKAKKKARKKARKKKCPVCKAFKTTVTLGCVTTGALFTVYMLNLDQKVLAWTYARVNEIFDRKPVDIKF